MPLWRRPLGSDRHAARPGGVEEINANVKSDDWKAKIQTKGMSDLHVVQVMIAREGLSAGTVTWGRAS